MQDSEFNRLADRTLDTLMQHIESRIWADGVDMDLVQGVLTLTIEATGKQFVVSRHSPSRQLWLSSPISGGLHFIYDEATGDWRCNGRPLTELLLAECEALIA